MNRIARIFLAAAVAVSPLISLAQQPLSLIPLPQKVEQCGGSFSFPALMSASAPAYEGDSVRAVLQRFTDKFTASTGVQFKQVKGKAKLQLRLDASLAPEAYRLRVDEGQISVEAARPAGFFYALQTLQQLLTSRQVLAGT